MRQLTCVLFVVGILWSRSGDADTRTRKMQGEVGYNVAHVEASDHKSEGDEMVIQATIKIVKSGSYVVIGGYYNGDCFQKGLFSGNQFFESTLVAGNADELVMVTLRVQHHPPVNTKVTVAVVRSKEDICTTS